MKKKLICLTTAMLLLLGLSGCAKDPETAFDTVNDVEGVTFAMKEDTRKSTRATFTMTNDTEEEITYRKMYHMETKKDDKWYEFNSTASAQWGDTTDTVAPGETDEFEIDWKNLCGPIKSGEHRIIMEVVDKGAVAVEFSAD